MHVAKECGGKLCCMVRAVGCLRNFSAGLHWSCFSPLPIPSYAGLSQWPNLTQRCCGKCSITKLLHRQPLTLCISFSRAVSRYDLDFVLHRFPVLIQVLSTFLLCINLFKSHSRTEHFDCEQIHLRYCSVFVQCLVQTLGKEALGKRNILENIIRFLVEGPLLSSHHPLPSRRWLGSGIFTVLILRRDPLFLTLPREKVRAHSAQISTGKYYAG